MGRLGALLGRATRRPRDPGLAVVLAAALVLSVAYGLWAWQRHRWYLTSGYDLGIFDQATRRLAHLDAPASSLREVPNLWGDHFHPIIVLWGALRAIWPSPVSLLVSQAVLVSAAMVPLYLVARDRAGRAAGVLLALTYGTSWGVQRAIDFDVHELAFAPVLLAAAVLAADRRRWGWFAVSVLLLLCVKEDVSLLVVAIGVWLALEGERRRGAATAVVGAAWFVLATRWWIPALGVQPFAYWTYSSFGNGPLSAIGGVLTHPWRLVTVAVQPFEKVETIGALLLPFLVVTPWLTRLAVLPLPLLAERFLSDQQVYWGTSFHYSLLPTMALALASAGGIATIQRQLQRRAERSADADARRRRRLAVRRAPLALTAVGLVVGTVIWFPIFGAQGKAFKPPLASLAELDPPPRIIDRHVQDRVVAATPSTGSVAAPRTLQPHLTGRDQPVYLLEARDPGEPPHVATADTVLLDLTDPSTGTVARPELLGPVTDALEARIASGGLVPIWSGPEGWVVLHAPTAPGGARRDPGLGTVVGAPARAARRAAAAWSAALRATAGACARTCTPQATATLTAAARRQATAVLRAAATSRGTCGPILRGVAGTDAQLLRDRAAVLDAPGDGGARLTYAEDTDGRLSGATRRALMICAPAATVDPGRGMPVAPVAPGA